MTLLTRQQIIEIWKKQPDELSDAYCCPRCRDILVEAETQPGMLYCGSCDGYVPEPPKEVEG